MDFLGVLAHLARNRVDFVIVGGVAARLHGSTRLTHDVDLVVRLEADIWARTVDAIWEKGGRPRIPESLERIRDLQNVLEWMETKHLLALSFSAASGAVEVDILLSEGHRFEELRSRALSVSLDDATYYVASIADLIEMKEKAGRPQDLLDIEELRRIKQQLDTAEDE